MVKSAMFYFQFMSSLSTPFKVDPLKTELNLSKQTPLNLWDTY